MAENKGITEVQALKAVVEFAPTPEIREKLEHMIEVRSRKHDRKKDDSKRLANIALGEEFASKWDGGDFKASDVRGVLGVSPAKATAICLAMEWRKVPTTEKVNVYSLD